MGKGRGQRTENGSPFGDSRGINSEGADKAFRDPWLRDHTGGKGVTTQVDANVILQRREGGRRRARHENGQRFSVRLKTTKREAQG